VYNALLSTDMSNGANVDCKRKKKELQLKRYLGQRLYQEEDVCKRPFILHGSINHPILVSEDICFVREEDFPFPESDRSQPKKDSPHRAHQDGHHCVQSKETWNLKRIAEHADARDPAHVRERQCPA
jgi:hypothetical protein